MILNNLYDLGACQHIFTNVNKQELPTYLQLRLYITKVILLDKVILIKCR